MAKVSVIIPVYKAEKYLNRCLDSLLAQTFENWNAICIDDGSPDNSGAILDSYADKDDRFIVVHKKNAGVSAARNDGIKKADGEYIFFMDADDWIDLDMFEKMYRKAKEFDADVVFCNRMYNNDSYRPTKDIPSGYYCREQILSNVLPLSLAYIGKNGTKRAISWSNCRRIYRRQLLNDFNFTFDKRFRRSQDLQLTYDEFRCKMDAQCMW